MLGIGINADMDKNQASQEPVILTESPQLMSNFPLVSVIIPAYNAEEFIERTLKSVLSQTYKNIEVLVIDDGSQDKTAQIVQAIANQDQRVILLQQPNAGVAAARNLGIQKSKGEFIAPVDADDIWYPQNIEKQVQCMLEGGTSVGLVYSWSVDIDENDQLTGAFRAAEIAGDVYTTLICHNFLGNASCSMLRRSCLDKVGFYNCELKKQDAQGCEDWDLYLRIAEVYKFKVVKQFLVGYRKLSESMSRNYITMARSHDLMLKTVQETYQEIPQFFYRLSRSNLYMYFAHQSHSCGNNELTLFWLQKAIKAEFMTPFLRLGLYRLLILILGNYLRRVLGFKKEKSTQLMSQRKPITFQEIEKKKLMLLAMIKIGNMFHFLIKNMYSYPLKLSLD